MIWLFGCLKPEKIKFITYKIKELISTEKMLGYIFSSELKIEPSEYNILLSETPMNPKENKEKLAQIIQKFSFEK